MTSYRASGPKSVEYNELDTLIARHYEHVRKNNQQQSEKFKTQIRKHVLTKGCSDEDLKPETDSNGSSGTPNGSSNALQRLNSMSHNPTDKLLKIGKAVPTVRKVEDTLRGRLWRAMLGTPHLNCNDYQKQINEKEYVQTYVKLRGDTKRTFRSSDEYMSRVAEERLVRVLNSYSQKYKKNYVQGMNVVAGGLLYVMPELDAFFTFCMIAEKHCPTYWYSDNAHRNSLIGAWAGSFLAWDILRACDHELWSHLKDIPAHMYLFPLIVGVQSIAKPFTELLRVWDFLFCFGLHLNPVVAVAQMIINRTAILQIKSHRQLLSGILSQLKWMNGTLNARKTIVCAMQLIVQLKSQEKLQDLWQQVLSHASNFDVAQQIKLHHEQEMKQAMFGQAMGGMGGMGMSAAIGGMGMNGMNGMQAKAVKKEVEIDVDDGFGSIAALGTNRGASAAAAAGAGGAGAGAGKSKSNKKGKAAGGAGDDSEESSEEESANAGASQRRKKKN